MPENANDIRVIRDLARQYAELAAKPIQDQRRALWRRHNSLQGTPQPPVLATYGMWNVWCREMFGDHAMQCQDGFWREHERNLRQSIFHDTIGDDFILEPWLTQWATHVSPPAGLWGVAEGRIPANVEGGAWQFDPPLKQWSDLARLVVPRHAIDEEDTARNVARLQDAVGDLLPVNVDRGPLWRGFWSDLATSLARLRGFEQIMVDMYEAPDQLKHLLSFMRDGVLKAQQEAEDAGDWTLTCHANQGFSYCRELADPRPNTPVKSRRELWGFCAAQEFTLISPRMHDEFLFQYQRPIYEKFGLVAYGCCEDLTPKIAMLRQLPNLRQIAVTPRADVARCAEQIGRDYVFSWRPNPTDMVCCGFDRRVIRRLLRQGLKAAQGCHVHVHLKDIETVEGQPARLAQWVQLVRDVAAAV